MPEEHPQLQEALDYLGANDDCAIVHTQSEHEVAIEFDRDSSWYVQTVLKESPVPEIVRKLKAAKLTTSTRKVIPQFGPHAGKVMEIVTVAGDFKSAKSAAQAALSVFDIIWKVPSTEWLWVAAIQPDDRDEPKRPVT